MPLKSTSIRLRNGDDSGVQRSRKRVLALYSSKQVFYVSDMVLGKPRVLCTVRIADGAPLPFFVGTNETPITLSKVEPKRVVVSLIFVKELGANYLADAVLRTPALLGSLELFGNVTSLKSVWAWTIRSCQRASRAISRARLWTQGAPSRRGGWVDVPGANFARGLLQSIAGFSSNIARNMDIASMDLSYEERRKYARLQGRPPLTVSRWSCQGSQGFRQGLAGAASGVITSDSVGQSVMGVPYKAAGGAAEFVSQTSHGILEEAGWQRCPCARSVHLGDRGSLTTTHSWSA